MNPHSGSERLHAQTEKRQARRNDDRDADEARRVDEDRPKHDPQHVDPDHAEGSSARGAGCFDIIEAANLRRHGLGDPGDGREENDRQRQNCIAVARPERAGQRDRQQHGREGEEHLQGAHDSGVDRAADIAGENAQRAADRQRVDHRHQPHEQRQPAAIDQPGQHVAAELVSAEQMLRRARRQQPAQHRCLIRIGRRDQRRRNRHAGNC